MQRGGKFELFFSQAQVFIRLHCVVQKSYCAMGQRLLQRPSYGCLYKGSASSARRRNRSPSAAHRTSLPSPTPRHYVPGWTVLLAPQPRVISRVSLRLGARGLAVSTAPLLPPSGSLRNGATGPAITWTPEGPPRRTPSPVLPALASCRPDARPAHLGLLMTVAPPTFSPHLRESAGARLSLPAPAKHASSA